MPQFWLFRYFFEAPARFTSQDLRQQRGGLRARIQACELGTIVLLGDKRCMILADEDADEGTCLQFPCNLQSQFTFFSVPLWHWAHRLFGERKHEQSLLRHKLRDWLEIHFWLCDHFHRCKSAAQQNSFITFLGWNGSNLLKEWQRWLYLHSEAAQGGQ